jgi:hypothetical protein
MDRIIFIGKSMAEPMLAICIPYNEDPQHCGNKIVFNHFG